VTLTRNGYAPKDGDRLRRRLGTILVAAAAGIILGAFGIYLVGRGSRPEPAAPGVSGDGLGAVRGTDEEDEFQALWEILEAEIEARIALADDLTQLRETVARLEQPAERDLATAAPGETSGEAAANAVEAGESEQDPVRDPPSANEDRMFDETALIGIGVYEDDARRLRERWEQWQMERLYIIDQATREGWLRSPRHRQEQLSVRQALREDLSDQDYDLLLFATGQPNRVAVRDVLDRSPARDAGLQTGDIILSYGDTRVFRPRELKRQTAAGEPGEFVRLGVARGDQRITLYVPRGPLGVFLKPLTLAPSQD
jgi:hypothetical protein